MIRLRSLSVLALIILVLPLSTAAQETLLGRGTEHGGFGGPSLKYTRLLDTDALMMGGLGAWVVGKTIGIGGGGWGLVTEHEVEAGGTTYQLELGYGGFLIEYLRDPDKLTHWYADVLIGIGGVSFLEAGSTGDESSYDDTIWVFEPSVNLCLNITQHFRAAVGVGYRKIIGLDSDTETTYGLTESQLDGYTIGLTLRFGSY